MLDILNASGLSVSYKLRFRRQASDPVPGRPTLFIFEYETPQESTATWGSSLSNRGRSQRETADSIENAVNAKWKLDRCTRLETERLSEQVRHAVDQYSTDKISLLQWANFEKRLSFCSTSAGAEVLADHVAGTL